MLMIRMCNEYRSPFFPAESNHAENNRFSAEEIYIYILEKKIITIWRKA